MSNHPENTLQAVFIPNGEGPGCGSLATWCPWCERFHYHGAAGRGPRPRIEKRGADNCYPDAKSFYRGTGYDLRVTGEVKDVASLLPKAPGMKANPYNRSGEHHRTRLYEEINKRERKIRQTILGAILGRKRAAAEWDTILLADGPRLLFGGAGAWWQVTNELQTVAKGKGLPSMAAYLYGIPEEITFIRIIEVATGHTFDCETVAAFQQNFREWRAAGSQARRTT
jgi:hypothetical protein